MRAQKTLVAAVRDGAVGVYYRSGVETSGRAHDGTKHKSFERHIAARIDVAEDSTNTRFDAAEKHLTALTEGQQGLASQAQGLAASVQELQTGQQALQAGQDQILAILTGRPKTND